MQLSRYKAFQDYLAGYLPPLHYARARGNPFVDNIHNRAFTITRGRL